LLNAGIRVPLVGGSGKDSNRIALGGVRTLTPRAGDGCYSEWVDHVKAGRTVATNGPYLRLILDDQEWSTSVGQAPDQPVRVRAVAESVAPFERIEVVANGVPVAMAAATAGETVTATIEKEHRLATGGWIAARCWGAAKSDLYPHVPVFAHTSPVWVEVPGQVIARQAAAIDALVREIQGVRDWVESNGRFTNPRRKEHLLGVCDAAIARLASPP
jgi:hypothetical protein